MSRVRLAAVLRWALVSMAVFVAVCAVALSLAPRIIDLPAVKAQMQAQLSRAMRGQVAWDTLDVRLFPSPQAVLRNASANLPGRLVGRVARVDVGLRLLPLLRGQPEVQSVGLVAPTVEIWLPSPGPSETRPSGPSARDPIAIYRSVMQRTVSTLRDLAPDMLLLIEAGSVDLHVPGLPVVIGAKNIALRAQTDATGLTASATASGNHWERIQLAGRVEFANLRARLTLDTVGAKPQTFLDQYFKAAQPQIELPTLSLHAEAATDARTSITVKASSEAPVTSLSRGERRLEVREIRVEGVIEVSPQGTEVVLRDVQLGQLLTDGEARLRLGGPQSPWQALVEVPGIDWSRLRAAAIALAGDARLVEDYAARVRGGQITDFRLSAEAESLAGLFSLPQMMVSANLSNGNVYFPRIEQDARDIVARFELDKGALKVRGAAARLGDSRLLDGSFDWNIQDNAIQAEAGFDLELRQALKLTRRLLPARQHAALASIESLSGAAHGRITATMHAAQWNVRLRMDRSDSQLRVREIPWPITLREAQMTASAERIQLANLNGSVGASSFRQAGVDLALKDPLRIGAAQGTATLVLSEIHPWLRAQGKFSEALRSISELSGKAEVTLNSLFGPLGKSPAFAYDVTVAPRNVRLQMADLPAPLSLDGGSIRIAPETMKLDGFGVAMLDAAARVSGKVTAYLSEDLQAGGTIGEAVAGEKFVDWLWQQAGLPPRVAPATPVRFAAERLRWSKKNGVELVANAQSGTGSRLGVDLRWQPDLLEIKRIAVKDSYSDAILGMTMRGREIDGRFSGELAVRSVAAFFRNASTEQSGRVTGEFRAAVDREHLDRFSAHGHVAGESVNLGWLLPVPLALERFSVEAREDALRMQEISVDWAGQKATLRGEIVRTATGAVVQASLDSPGIVIDALLPARSEGNATPAPDKTPEAVKLWPLPMSGKLTVNAQSLQGQGYTVQPVRATVTLEPERVHIDVAEAALCGIAFPFFFEATPQGSKFTVRLSAKDQQLDQMARCFTDQQVLITGRFDLSAELSSAGARTQLLPNLTGPAQFSAHDGKIMKFAMLGNILSLKGVTGMLKKGFKFEAEGFDYRSLEVKGNFGDGKFSLEQGSLDSAALGLAATGSIALADRTSDLTVLVAPFGRIDRLVRNLPVLGYILGGNITGLPVGVSGDIRNPSVVPLGAKAVTSELAGIFERTFQLPAKLLEPLTPGQPATR
jgi:uncharacterized protein involved in outer membrane biogenesis